MIDFVLQELLFYYSISYKCTIAVFFYYPFVVPCFVFDFPFVS